MDFVTITDHDTIEGNLEISDLKHTFISEEITTYFPHDPCKLHLLVWGITEAQHAEIAASAREHLRPAKLPAKRRNLLTPSRTRFIASMASSKPRTSND